MIDSVKAHDHPTGSRGIVVWNGLKSNITISNCEVYNNNCCGIELQDGTASGVNIYNNNVHDNIDNGLGLSGMNGATGANIVRKNIVANNGRFGIEVKNPKGTSGASGIGSILVDSNTVSLTATVGMNIRDHAGIAVFRRAFQAGNPDGYPNIPTGVVVQNNTVSGYTHLNPGRLESEGFGIVVEGTNHKVLNNNITTSNIGIQEQGGAHPNSGYVADNAGDGNQTDNFSANYFGRGNAPVACGNIISGNTFSGNTTNQRTSTGAGSFGLVTNTNTGETFCSIQAAIDDAQTLNGHIITVGAGTFNEQVLVNKEVTIKNATNVRPVINFTGTPALVSGAKTLFEVTAPNVTIDSLEFSVDVTKLGSAILASSATLNNLTVIDNSINPYRSAPATLSFGLRNAISVNVTPRVNSNNPTMLIQNNTITYNVGVDLTPGTADDAGFRSGVATDEGGGTITLNTITTISHDVLVRFGGNPAGMSITSNNFNGGGVELSDQNAACGPMVVSNNIFTGAGAPNTAVLRIKNNYDGITHTISSNTFTNHEWAISSENMKAVTFNANTFNTASPTAHSLVINTKSISTNSAAIVQIAIAATITNNNFNGTGNAIAFLNHDSDNDTYGTITMGTAGNENNFAATLSTFVVFDSQTGVSSGSVFPNYTATIGAGAGALTTMACWDVNLNAQNNKYDVGAGLQLPIAMSFAGRTTLETKLNHKPDNACLGSLLYYLPVHNLNQNTYYLTIQEGVNAAVAGEVLECDAWTFNEHVIVDKSLTLQGVDSATCIITGTGFPAGNGTAGNGSGIVINNGITNVTIKKFKVQNFMGFNGNQDAGIYAIGGNNTLLVEDVTLLNNVGGSGFYANGPVNGVTINRVTSTGHTVGARGIVIWNGLKENITITNCNVFGNNCCGIELQDGTATGVIMTGNNVHDNGDNGLGLMGLGGPGSNLIQNNTVTNNGRFGIEVKNPNGSGTNSGAGSVVIDNNTVSRTVAIVDARDIAGIAVFRRGVGAGNVDVPYGAYVSNNSVSGYAQPSTSDGFGIVVEGINHTVATNTLNGNDVGIQRQAGHTPYPGDGNQNNIVDTYFGRGNAPYTCGVTLTGNILGNILANGINTRDVGSVSGVNIVTNTNTSETFCTIQQAIDDAQTVAGNTLSVPAGTYAEDIIVSKSLSILGPNAAINPCSGTRVAEAKIVPATADIVLREIMHVAASNVTISGFTIDGDNPLLTSGFTSTNGADIDAAEGVTVYETAINNLTVTNNIIQNLSYFGVTLYDYPAGLPSSGHVISNNKIRDLGTYDASSTIDYWGGGVLLYNNQYAAVTNNCMTNVRLGVQTGNFSQANPGLAASQFITGNSIQARRIGVFHNLHYTTASGYTINNNTFTGLANANESGVIGIELASLSVPSFAIDNNINLTGVSTNTTGYEIWNVKNTFPASISGGTVSNVNTGIFANNYEGYSSDAPDGAHAVVTDITVTPNAAGTGVRVLDSPSSTLHANVVLNVTNSFITGGTDGVKFEGLSVNGPINNNSITGNSNKSINATAYTGGTAIDVTCNWYGSAVAGVVATEITGNVTYIPYLNNGTDNSAAQGFQPVPGSCLGITVTLTIAGTNVSCFGGNNGTATVTVVTGLAPYTYFWNNMQTAATAVNLIAGTYTVTVTDANGSTASASVVVTQPLAGLTANCSVTNVSCFGLADGTAQVVAAGGTPPYTYLWNPFATTSSLSGLVAGSYAVTVSDANGCTATCIATVTQPGEILITLSKNSTPCAGGGTTANVCASATNGAGPFTYLWNTGATTPCLSDVAAGTYTVTVTNTANGCTRTKSITVN
ncbi:MAG: right-handed parallel beta-helix repeat-containing protein [Bacteroidetes bacterium]|nr:right-handed parallel beta-helix repeat-containing protein [Bacteroidota bacterium]